MDIELCIFSQCMYKHQCIDNFHHPHTHVEISQLVKDVFAAGLWQVCGQFYMRMVHTQEETGNTQIRFQKLNVYFFVFPLWCIYRMCVWKTRCVYRKLLQTCKQVV